ncbi:hypothetical protein [Celeribacter baekdonensis]|uniref:hypothetical protein n=1 Tax=Celeribacter baekdonensis TaxID=875171 RepID=UPI0030DA0CCD|tara:strand:- start:2666 stop:3334 length:669 start_codon:yes stop_codon:yes gene_type:complete
MLSLTRADETKGNTCERYDADAGLFSYSFNDPVNLSDPEGNFVNIIVGAALNVMVDAVIASRTGQSYGLFEATMSAAAGGLAGAAGTGAFQIAHKAIKLTKAARLAKVGTGAYAGAAASVTEKVVSNLQDGTIVSEEGLTDTFEAGLTGGAAGAIGVTLGAGEKVVPAAAQGTAPKEAIELLGDGLTQEAVKSGIEAARREMKDDKNESEETDTKDDKSDDK